MSFSIIFIELYPYVTCGSVVKLMNNNFKVRLHSHEVKYGTGSQQQVCARPFSYFWFSGVEISVIVCLHFLSR